MPSVANPTLLDEVLTPVVAPVCSPVVEEVCYPVVVGEEGEKENEPTTGESLIRSKSSTTTERAGEGLLASRPPVLTERAGEGSAPAATQSVEAMVAAPNAKSYANVVGGFSGGLQTVTIMSDQVVEATVPSTVHQSEVQLKKSWASVVSRPSLSKFNYEISEKDGKATVAVPDEVLEDATPLWEDFLIGRFASAAPHVAKIHVIVNKIWNLGDKSIRVDVFSVNETTVKFRIRNASARLRALRRGMWNICEIPMVVSKWTPFVEEAQPAIRSMPMWVKIKNVPYSMFTWKGISFLASPIGHPIRLHRDTELVTSFEEAKVFVDVDLSKELPKSYYFNIKGEEVNVTFEYPWLPQRCSICKKWGHTDDCCLANGRKVSNSHGGSSRCATPVGVIQGGESNQLAVTVSTKLTKVSTTKETCENVLHVEEVNGVKISSEQGAINSSEDVNQQSALALVKADEEEGEIVENPVEVGIIDPTDEEGWQISLSGRRSPNKQSKELVYGQVQIASPSSFDVLRDHLTEEDQTAPIPAPTGMDNASDGDPALCLEADLKNVNIEGTARASLPRSSKKSHKFLSATTQKTRDVIPSNFKKRNSKAKH